MADEPFLNVARAKAIEVGFKKPDRVSTDSGGAELQTQPFVASLRRRAFFRVATSAQNEAG